MPAHATRSNRCHQCGWHLRYRAHGRSWIGFCWNPGCPVDRVYPHKEIRLFYQDEVFRLIRENGGDITSVILADKCGLKLPAASERLRTMYEVGMLTRVQLQQRGHAYVYRPI